jgi:hypothetical protein
MEQALQVELEVKEGSQAKSSIRRRVQKTVKQEIPPKPAIAWIMTL